MNNRSTTYLDTFFGFVLLIGVATKSVDTLIERVSLVSVRDVIVGTGIDGTGLCEIFSSRATG